MKILIGINALSSGGAEVFTAELAVSYVKKGNDVFLISYAGSLNEKGDQLKEYLISNNVKILDFSLKPKLVLFFYYIRSVLSLKPDLIHSNLEQTDLLLIISKIFNRKSKYIRTLHNIKSFEKFPVWLHKLLFKYYDHNVGCSSYTKTHYNIIEQRGLIIAIDNGIDTARLTNKVYEDNQSSLAKENATIFLVIGTSQKRFGQYQKGHDLIIDAFKEIKTSYKVLFLGDIENMKTDFDNIQIYPNFELIGVTSNINKYIEISDFMLAPSRFEGLPISTIEAVCSGLPLLCSDIEGFMPFDRESTLFFESENVEDLVRKLQIAIASKEWYKNKALENRSSYIQQFDINEVAKKYLNFL